MAPRHGHHSTKLGRLQKCLECRKFYRVLQDSRILWNVLYLSEAPHKIGLWYLKEAKILIPDSVLDPTEDALDAYLHEFEMHTEDGHRRLTALGAFTVRVVA